MLYENPILKRKEVAESHGGDWSLLQLTAEELAIMLNEEIEKEPTAEELRALVPGYEERILAAVLARIVK